MAKRLSDYKGYAGLYEVYKSTSGSERFRIVVYRPGYEFCKVLTKSVGGEEKDVQKNFQRIATALAMKNDKHDLKKLSDDFSEFVTASGD